MIFNSPYINAYVVAINNIPTINKMLIVKTKFHNMIMPAGCENSIND